MGFRKGQNPHHPRKGASIKVDPIRDLQALARIKQNLSRERKIRDLCLFTLGINTAWRANELLSIRVGHVQHLKKGDKLELKQSKTNKYRITPLNPLAMAAVQNWLDVYAQQYPNTFSPDAPLFPSHTNCRAALLVPSVTALVKKWCMAAGVYGRFGSHTMRKTWGYHQRVTFHSPLALISQALGHRSEDETLTYIGILPCEIDDLYKMEL